MKILSRNTHITLFAILMIVFMPSCHAQKGDGGEKNPFVIASAQELLDFANKVNEGNTFKGKYFVLKNDIDLSMICGENKGNWIPIGTVNPMEYDEVEGLGGNSFEGVFDGKGYMIKNIYIGEQEGLEEEQERYQGLFGLNKGEIKNLSIKGSIKPRYGDSAGICAVNSKGLIENCHNQSTIITGSLSGGICSFNFLGKILNCSNSGYISGLGIIGGICGENLGTIENCYNIGNITAESCIGGICGIMENGKIRNCYVTSDLQGMMSIGDICGAVYNGGVVENCYNTGNVFWGTDNGRNVIGEIDVEDIEVDNIGINCYGLVNKTACKEQKDIMNLAGVPCYLLDENHFSLIESFAGWDFENVWEMSKDFNRPILQSNKEKITRNIKNQILNNSNLSIFSAGDGSEENPYVILNVQDLILLAKKVNSSENTFKDKFFILKKNIDLSSECGPDKGSWIPIGAIHKNNEKLIYRPFEGSFDGNGYSISNLFISNMNDYCNGLFGWNEGIIKNLTVFGYVASTGKYIGGICGYNNSGTIWNCKNLCTITAYKDVGGVCGYNEDGLIALCSNVVDVLGNENVGGICGDNSHGIIRECFNVGNIVAEEDSGGICGSNSDVLINCYNIGNVSGINDVAGICNNLLFSQVTACYNMGKVKGEDFIGGIVGNRSGSVSSCYYQVGKAKGGMNSKDYVGQVDALDENQFFNKSSFKMWDFDSIWEMSDSLKRPILRSNKEK